MEFIQGKWSLNDLYPEGNKEAFQAELDQLKQKAEAFTAVRGELQASLEPKRFLEILKDYEAINEISRKLGGYTSLQVSADTQNAAYLSQMVQTRAALTEVSNQVMFFELWFRGLSDEEAAPFLTVAEGYR